MDERELSEFYFLSECYEHGTSEEVVYAQFVRKCIADGSLEHGTLSQIHSFFARVLHFDIPPTIIDLALKGLSREFLEVVWKSEQLKVVSIPPSLKASFDDFQRRFDSGVSLVTAAFNIYLERSGVEPLPSEAILYLLHRVLRRLTIDELATPSSVPYEQPFFEWVARLYRSDALGTVRESLNRILYSQLVYHYFAKIRRAKKHFSNTRVYLDTNLIVFALGINGESRQTYASYLFTKLKDAGCTAFVTGPTLQELRDLVRTSQNDEIRLFTRANPSTATSIINRTYQSVERLLQSCGLRYEFDDGSVADAERNYRYWPTFSADLRSYKNSHRMEPVGDYSIAHDVNLLFRTEAFQKYSSLYAIPKIAVTADMLLVKWFAGLAREEFGDTVSPVLSLHNLSLVLWAETAARGDEKFIPETWAFIAETIPYFHDAGANSVFRLAQKKVADAGLIPDDWRSMYILLRNEMPDVEVWDAKRDQVLAAIDKLVGAESRIPSLERGLENSKAIAEQDRLNRIELLSEVATLRAERAELRTDAQIGQELRERPLRFLLRRVLPGAARALAGLFRGKP